MKGIASVILAGIVILVIAAGAAVYYSSITGFFALGSAQQSSDTGTENVSEPGTGGTGLVIGEPVTGTGTPSGTEPGTPPESESDSETGGEQTPPGGGGGGGGGSYTPPCTPNKQYTADWSECINGMQSRPWSDGCGNSGTDTPNCTSPADNEIMIFLSPADTNVILNDNFNVGVNINTTVSVFAADLQFYYNPSILSTAKSKVTEGDFLTKDVAQWSGYDTFAVISVNNVLGRIRFSATRYCDCAGVGQPECENTGICPINPVGVDGTGTLFTAEFDTVDIGTSNLDLGDIVLSDMNLQPIVNVSAENGTVIVNVI